MRITDTSLKNWIHAAAEATNEFAEQALGIKESCNIEIINDMSCRDMAGSSLLLHSSDTSIKVGFFSSDVVLMKIAKLILDIPSADELSRNDMIDAINEIINIISGGVKRRLNDQASGGISLGLPSFIEADYHDCKKNEETLFARMLIAEMPILLLASVV